MKIELIDGEEEARPGFIPVRADFHHLDGLVEDAEATEIIANDVIDLLEHSGTTLAHWAGKLRRGGTLTVGGLEFPEVCRRAHERHLPLRDAIDLAYGGGRRSAGSAESMSAALEGLGLTIINRRFVGYHYSVTARRP